MHSPRLIAHILHRLDFGGLENGLINLINRIPEDRYHHAIICMTEYTDFSNRITNRSVTLHALHKSQGKDLRVYIRLLQLLRQLKPDIVHTRNLSALEGAVVARFAGVAYRVHGEHGRDSYDIDGTNRKYLILRRLCQPFVQRYIPLSQDLERWLLDKVGIPENKIHQIYNGVDTDKFRLFTDGRRALPLKHFSGKDQLVIGTVGRLQEVKDQLTLIRAFSILLNKNASYRKRLRLIIVGDGPMGKTVESLIRDCGLEDVTWLAGARNDIPQLLQAMDLFVLPSKAEGISNTILEAMAVGLPVIATSVGGNPELVVDGDTGLLVPAEDAEAMASAMESYIVTPEILHLHGHTGRLRVESQFSIDSMVNEYITVYDSLS